MLNPSPVTYRKISRCRTGKYATASPRERETSAGADRPFTEYYTRYASYEPVDDPTRQHTEQTVGRSRWHFPDMGGCLRPNATIWKHSGPRSFPLKLQRTGTLLLHAPRLGGARFFQGDRHASVIRKTGELCKQNIAQPTDRT